MANIGKELDVLGIRNPKEILIRGLEQKIAEQGNLRQGFDITTDYPSRETYDHDAESRRIKRRIVVRQMSNTVERYALGQLVSGEFDDEDLELHEVFGWADLYNMEISIWSPDSKDRDNIVELIKLWMLELEQDIKSGSIELGLPFFFDKDIFAIRFIRAYEGVNSQIYRNGPIYIGSLVYNLIAPFYHSTSDNDYQRYKIHLIGQIVDCIERVDVQANQEE